MTVLVGRKAPDFTTPAVLASGEIVDKFNLYDCLKSKQVKTIVIFFYPLDFTFVCPSELIALDHRTSEFASRGVEVIVLDDAESYKLMQDFIVAEPTLWNEDIGEED